jgi:hypothetical protein
MTLAVYTLADSVLAATPLDDGAADHLAAVDAPSVFSVGYFAAAAEPLAIVDHTTSVMFAGLLIADHLVIGDVVSVKGQFVSAAVDVLVIQEARPVFFYWIAEVDEPLQLVDLSQHSLAKTLWDVTPPLWTLWVVDTTPGQP